jgi:hypothetical protein
VSRAHLDLGKLSASSREFGARLFAAIPQLVQHASMESAGRPETFELSVEVPSPTGDPQRKLVIWMEDGEPSLGFGPWHTHCCLFGDVQGAGCDGLIDVVGAILADKFVLCCDVGGEHDGHCRVLDLRDADALADEVTSQYSPGTVSLRSWGGSADRSVRLADL